MVEAPLELQKTLQIPDDHYAACKAAGIPTEGNAAGNKANPLDLAGANVSPPRIPNGFTPRGIVAMTFSVVAAILGCVVIAWYGLMPLKG
jgi:iron transport multicopper oxidase